MFRERLFDRWTYDERQEHKHKEGRCDESRKRGQRRAISDRGVCPLFNLKSDGCGCLENERKKEAQTTFTPSLFLADISINNCASSTAPPSQGVPQGSVLGPLRFILSTAPHWSYPTATRSTAVLVMSSTSPPARYDL